MSNFESIPTAKEARAMQAPAIAAISQRQHEQKEFRRIETEKLIDDHCASAIKRAIKDGQLQAECFSGMSQPFLSMLQRKGFRTDEKCVISDDYENDCEGRLVDWSKK